MRCIDFWYFCKVLRLGSDRVKESGPRWSSAGHRLQSFELASAGSWIHSHTSRLIHFDHLVDAVALKNIVSSRFLGAPKKRVNRSTIPRVESHRNSCSYNGK